MHSAKVAIGQTIVDKTSLKKKRDKTNFYPTPEPFIEWALTYLWDKNLLPSADKMKESVLDVGAGTGNWGRVYYRLTGYKIDGIEKYVERFKDADYSCYNNVYPTDVLQHDKMYYACLGNPPYTRGSKKQGEPSTTAIVDHVIQYFAPIGFVAFLLPTNFRHGTTRFKTLPTPAAIVDLANRINFETTDGKGGSYPGEYCLMIWDNEIIPDNYYKGYTAMWA